jgi:hypothetical protein
MGDQSLYIGASGLASGAAYLSDVNTNRRIASPNINTTGYTTVILGFDYIGNGEGATDKAYLVYSTDGGTSWTGATGAPTSVNPAMGTGGAMDNLKSQLCGAQGLWTHVTWAMPVSCENISNLRVGFVWQSDNNSAGSDPSFAVDDVTITATITPTPIKLLNFTAKFDGQDKVVLTWSTGTESNNDFFTLERSGNGLEFNGISIVNGAGNSSHTISYSEVDDAPLKGLSYYRLKQTDFNGGYSYSDIVPVEISTGDFAIVTAYGNREDGLLEVTYNCTGRCKVVFELYDMAGRRLSSFNAFSESNLSKISIPLGDFTTGIYLLKASNGSKVAVDRFKL